MQFMYFVASFFREDFLHRIIKRLTYIICEAGQACDRNMKYARRIDVFHLLGE